MSTQPKPMTVFLTGTPNRRELDATVFDDGDLEIAVYNGHDEMQIYLSPENAHKLLTLLKDHYE